jgi:hypothetical protein
MNRWYIIVLLIIFIILIACCSFIKSNNISLNKSNNISLNNSNIEYFSEQTITCRDRIINYKNFNLDDLTEEQQKVLSTLRILNAKVYSDDSRDFPDWKNSCVIPSDHLLIFNKDPANTSNWLNMRYTKENEVPKGYVIDLDKYTESSFKQLLTDLYKLYDKEFIDQMNELQDKIDKWTKDKLLKEVKLTNLDKDLEQQQNILNNTCKNSY